MQRRGQQCECGGLNGTHHYKCVEVKGIKPVKYELHKQYLGWDVYPVMESEAGRMVELRLKSYPKIIRYEVTCRMVRKAEKIVDKEYPDREVYPASEMWGDFGWTYIRMDLAIARFKSLP